VKIIREERALQRLMLLTRFIVPAWILAGAVSKLLENSPAKLPVALIKVSGALGIDLGYLFHMAVGVELAAVGVMIVAPSLSPLIAAGLLLLFFPILVGDLFLGASSCGCFGSVQVHPDITLSVEAALLVAVFVAAHFVRWRWLPGRIDGWRVVVALAWTVTAFAVAFGYPLAQARADSPPATAPGATPAAPSPAGAPAVPAYYLPDYGSWMGKPWKDLDLARWVKGRVSTGPGVRYVILYRKDCEHCHELLATKFAGELPYPTTVIAVPEKAGFPQDVLPMPCTQCSQAELPSGCDWFFKTPVVIRLEDGIVSCAQEVDPEAPACIDW
jgi:hypothetical protein